MKKKKEWALLGQLYNRELFLFLREKKRIRIRTQCNSIIHCLVKSYFERAVGKTQGSDRYKREGPSDRSHIFFSFSPPNFHNKKFASLTFPPFLSFSPILHFNFSPPPPSPTAVKVDFSPPFPSVFCWYCTCKRRDLASGKFSREKEEREKTYKEPSL